MRVLFFNEGNLGSHVMGQGQLSEALRVGLAESSGVEADFAGLTPMGKLAGALANRPLPVLAGRGIDLRVLRWHLVQSMRARGAVAQALDRQPADVLHVHTQAITFGLTATMRRIPTVISIDATIGDWAAMSPRDVARRYVPGPLAPSRALERRVYERAALTMAWTEWAKRGVERLAPGASVIAHHPGIDLHRYKPAVRRPRERPRVLFIGGRFEHKGGPELLAALAGKLGTEVDLDLVTPAQLPDLPGVSVHRLGPSDPQLLDLHQQADVLCLPSHGDAVPWAVLEAMACGTPVLASNVGAIPDLLDEGRAGILVDPGDGRRLGEALARLLGDADLRRELAGRGRERCEERYDARRQVPLLIERMRELRAHAPRS
jgi:glycosyltransferase involved in cell wall biosynthesis